MRRTWLGAAVLFLGAAAAAGQPPALPGPGPKPSAGSGLGAADYKMLLLTKAVQKDLELTTEQTKAVANVGTENTKKLRDATKDLAKTVPVARDRIAKRAEIHEMMEKEYHEGLAKHLSAGQLKRLGQIRIQAEGPVAFAWPAVAEPLKLTAEQKNQVEKLARDLHADTLSALKKNLTDGGNELERLKAVYEKINELERKAAADTVNLLDANQKKAWKELTGEPFDLSKVGVGGIFGKD